MPFEFRIEKIEKTASGEFAATGRVTKGAYFGPEVISVTLSDGSEMQTCVGQHGMLNLRGWPVLPEHFETRVILHFAALEGVEIDLSKPIVGGGVVLIEQDRLELDESVLDDVRFYALLLAHHLASADLPDPNESLFATSAHEVNDYYESLITNDLQNGISPFVRLPLGADCYVEIEFSGHVEFQIRYWIGQHATKRRVLLGYHSGHFSLPAFRAEELLWMASNLPPKLRAATLLFAPSCYINRTSDDFEQQLASLFESAPFPNGKAADAARVLIVKMTQPHCSWHRDEKQGWLSSSENAQRNPNSRLSLAKPEDYAFIQDFFSAIGDSNEFGDVANSSAPVFRLLTTPDRKRTKVEAKPPWWKFW